MEKAIKKAIEGGYNYANGSRVKQGISAKKAKIFLDPLFWQALAMARGTKGDEIGDGMGGWIPEWQFQWHHFIEALTEGKSTDEFFDTLLK